MSESFDPYHKWLGVRPEQQPANHYRLLGVHAFEGDLAVVENAADQRMAYLRKFQSGKHAHFAEQLLNEIASAKLCLLDPAAKAAYDAELRQRTMVQSVPAPAPVVTNVATPAAVAGTAAVIPLSEPPDRAVPAETVEAPRAGSFPAAAILGIAGAAALGFILIAVVGGLVWKMASQGQGDDESVAQGVRVPPPAARPLPRSDLPDRDAPPLGDSDPAVPDDDDNSDTDGTQQQDVPVDDAPSPEQNSDDSEPDNATDDSAASEVESSTNSPLQSTEAAAPGGDSEETTAPDDHPPVEPQDVRRPVPDKAMQETVSAQVEEIYPPAKYATPTKQVELARELLRMGREASDQVDERFVLYRRAMEAACQGGEATVMLSAVDAIGADYAVDPYAVKFTMLRKYVGAGDDPARVLDFLKVSQQVTAAAMAAGKYQEATRLSLAACGFCDRPVGSSDFRQSIRDQHVRIERTFQEYEKFERAEEQLAAVPTDADAHLAAGRWFCFVQGDWERGLPHLAQSSDQRLKEIAVREQSGAVDDIDTMIELGDAWYALVESSDEESQLALARRAQYWYDRIVSQPITGIKKLKVQKQQKEIAELLGGLEPFTWDFAADVPSGDTGISARDDTAPNEYEAVFTRGVNAAVESHDFEAAERFFASCTRMKPDHVPALNNYALTSVRTRDYRRAIRLWQEATALAPQQRELRHNLERFRRLTDGDDFQLERALSRSLEELCAKVDSRRGYMGSTGWLYLPIDDQASYSSSRYEDDRCMYCGGSGDISCPVRGCARGSVRRTRTDVVGRNSVTGQSILKTTPYRVECSNCDGDGKVDCRHCSGGRARSMY